MEADKNPHELLAENDELRARLGEALSALPAIGNGDVDAIILQGKRGEQVYTLKGSEHPYRMLVEQMSEAAVTMRRDGMILYSNRRFSELIGLATGSRLRDYVPASDQTAFDQLVERAATGKARGEMSLRAAGGGTVPVYLSLSALPLEDGTVVSVLITDLSEQKRTEELRAREVLFRTMAESIPDMIARLDHRQHCSYLNPAFETHTGVPASECADQPFEGLGLPGEVVERWRAALGQASATGQPAATEFTLRVDGDEHFFHATVVPEVSGGEVKSFVTVARDVTGRQKLVDGLVRAKQAADEASRAKSDFLANMSHEMRTPLNGMLGMLQIIKTTRLDAEQNDYLDVAIRSGQRLTTLLSDILDLSRIEAGRVQLHETRFTFRDIHQAMRDTFVPVCGQGPVALELTIHPSADGIFAGDKARISQILFNVVGNAIKFSNAGSVEVTVSCLPSPWPGQVWAIIEVIDTGIGISEENIDSIFGSFTQVEGAYTRRYQGAGLGLPLVKKLVEMMHGSLTIRSDVGKGTTLEAALLLRVPEQ